jgi:predicted ATPase
MPFVVREVHAAGYRSLRAIRFPVGRLSVFLGPNGAGKTNLYRALQLLQAAATGTLSRELAAEGGMASAVWAGGHRAKQPIRITLGASFGLESSRDEQPTYSYEVSLGQVSYEISLGIAQPAAAAFLKEPQIKDETLSLVPEDGRPVKMMERRGPHVTARDEDGRRVEVGLPLMASETALGSIEEPQRFPDLHMVRRTMLDWRFYHDFRTDTDSALRRPCLAVTSPTLASDGANLAAVFATLVHIRQDTKDLRRMIDDAFPGARLVVPQPDSSASFAMLFREFPNREFSASELSDGTLRYLALAGALMAYRLPSFIALNEPETSLHPDLLDPLARLVANASERAQIWLVTHSEPFANALAKYGNIKPFTVIKREGETWIEGLKLTGGFRQNEQDEQDKEDER